MAKRTSRRRARRQPRPTGRVPAPQPSLATGLRDACALLTALDVPYALIGGLAVSARAEPRLTRDVDLAIAAEDDAAAEALVRELVARGYRLRASVEQTRTGRLATVRLGTPGAGAGFVLDLLFASSGIEPEIVAAAEPLEILPDLVVPVARTGHLIAMKLLARDDRARPQDADDLRSLVAIASAAERRRATTAIALIQRRGFARGRDLAAAWRAVATPRSRR